MRLVFLLAVISVTSVQAQSPVLRQGQNVLWRDPGEIASLDFRYGYGGAELAPRPPFTFLDEDLTGSTRKIQVKDADGREYSVKFGDEAHADTFGTRIAWALGYYVQPTYFVAEGTVQGVKALKRARKVVDQDGRFRNARFQLRSHDMKFLRYASWLWDNNPFLGTPELKGLKILMMLLSNWDNKDSRDAGSRGTNTAIFQKDDWMIYFIDDWGGAMGNWGKVFTRSKWDAKDFDRQSDDFVKLRGGKIDWGYVGQHSSLLTSDITFGDVTWFLPYLERVTDAQLRAGLLASGASEEAAGYFTAGLRKRISQLRALQQ